MTSQRCSRDHFPLWHHKAFANGGQVTIGTTVFFAVLSAVLNPSCVVNLDIDPNRVMTDESDELDDRTSCSFGPEDFHDGLFGYCQMPAANNNGFQNLWYRDLSGNEIFRFEWNSNILLNAEALKCTELCRAGAWEIAVNTDKLNTAARHPLAPEENTRSCPIVPDAEKHYPTCDDLEFSCIGQCGIGCSGCQVEVAESCSEKQNCRRHHFQCYTRPCCVDHSACLQSATTLEQRILCHIQAEQLGCGIHDLKGQSYFEEDAQCSPLQSACIKDQANLPPD